MPIAAGYHAYTINDQVARSLGVDRTAGSRLDAGADYVGGLCTSNMSML